MANRSSRGLGIVFVAASAAFASIVAAAAFAQPPDRARTEALARRATDRLHALQREADRLASDERTVLGDLRTLEIERQLKAEEIKQLDADIDARTERDAADARRAALQQSELAQRPEL